MLIIPRFVPVNATYKFQGIWPCQNSFIELKNACQSPAPFEGQEMENMTFWQISVSLVQFAHVRFQSCLPLRTVVTCVALPRVCQKSHVVSDFRGVPIQSSTLLGAASIGVLLHPTWKLGCTNSKRFLIIVWAQSLDRWNWKEGTIGGVEDIMQEGGGGGGQLRRCVWGELGGKVESVGEVEELSGEVEEWCN